MLLFYKSSQETDAQLTQTEYVSSKKRGNVFSDRQRNRWLAPPLGGITLGKVRRNLQFPFSTLFVWHIFGVQSEQMWYYCSGRPFRLIFTEKGDRQIGRWDVIVIFFCGSNIALGKCSLSHKRPPDREVEQQQQDVTDSSRWRHGNKERLQPAFTAEGWWIKAPY